LSLNLYTYCLNNPHKYTDPSGHIPLLLIGVALFVGAVSAKAEYDRQVREGDNYTNLVSIGVVGISNTLLCLIPGGKAVSAYKMATAGGSFVLKTFAVQFGKAIGLGIAAGYATDAGIEVARQLATGTKLSNLEYDRINEAGVTGAIAGGAGAIFGAGVEALANTRVGRRVAEKFTQAVSKGKNAIKSQFAKIATKNGKTAAETATGLKEPMLKMNLQFFASDEAYKSGSKTNLASYYEYKALKQQGYNASDAYDLMKQFRSGVNPNNEFVFHFTTMKGGKGITDIGGIYGSKSGVWGKGIYTGTTPTPSWALKHIPWSGWGLGSAPVRIPIKLNSSMKTSKPIIPIKSVVIRTDFLEFQ